MQRSRRWSTAHEKESRNTGARTELTDLSEPKVLTQQAAQSELVLTAPLNSSTGFYIRAHRQISERQTRHHKVELFDTPQFGLVMRVDGRNTTAEREDFVHYENLIHPALSAHAAPRKVLIIGG